MKLSIIVPVYNVEATVGRCLSSLTQQSVADAEIIIVDDGSTDGSMGVCRSFVEGRDNVRLISQPNRGLGAARNRGIAEAQGDWLYFIDSDDELAPDTLSAVLSEAEKSHADIVEFPFLTVRQGSKETLGNALPEPIGVPGDYDPMTYWLSTLAWRHTYACNKLFRASLFSSVKWAEGVRFEDSFTLPLLLNQAHRVRLTSRGLYYYYKNEAGLSATATYLHSEQLLTAQWRVLKQLISMDKSFVKANRKTLAIYYADVVNIQITALNQGASRALLPVLPYWQTPKLKLLHLVGFKMLARICSFLS